MKTLLMLLVTASWCSIIMVGCTDAGVEPGPTTLPRPTSAIEARNLLIGRWKLEKFWLYYAEESRAMPQEMVFSPDGFARTYSEGQLIRAEHYAIIESRAEYRLALDSTGTMFDFRIAGDYFSWDHRIWDGDARLFRRTGPWE